MKDIALQYFSILLYNLTFFRELAAVMLGCWECWMFAGMFWFLGGCEIKTFHPEVILFPRFDTGCFFNKYPWDFPTLLIVYKAFTFMYLAHAFIQSDLHWIHYMHFNIGVTRGTNMHYLGTNKVRVRIRVRGILLILRYQQAPYRIK